MSIIKRGKSYHLRRRVPKRYARIDPRSLVYLSLATDSEGEARAKADAVWKELISGWEAELNGSQSLAKARYGAAKELAARRGFDFLPVSKVAELPLSDLLGRVVAVQDAQGNPDKFRAEAFLGGAKEPSLTVTEALGLYWDLTRDKISEKSDDQVRRWRNPRVKAIGNFVEAIGDIPLSEITADHTLDFRAWWWDRIAAQGLTANSANKDFTHLGEVLKSVCKMKRLGFVPPVSGLRFKESDKGKRPAFSTKFIKDQLLAPDALSSLNPEARLVLLGMVNTGYRPSEGAALLPEHIRLDCDIPHIQIRPEGRELKTRRAKRDIPLVGVSLEAFRACPGGAPRYRDKPGLSATLNKYLRAHGLAPTPDHTVYGLRHSFEDRLLVAGVDERVRRDLMGHALGREEYGEGGGLEFRRAALDLIAL